MEIVLFAFVACVTPGPNNIMIMASGLNYGVRRTLPHLLGIGLGFPAMFVAVGLGLGSAFERFPALHGVIKVLGISALLYMAYQLASARIATRAEDHGRPLRFLEAVLFQWVNPKAWVNSMGAIAAFTTVNGEVLSQALWIALAFLLVCLPSVCLWLFSGAAMRQWLTQAKQARAFNRLMAGLLCLSIVPILFP